MSNTMSYMLRNIGYSKEASFGLGMGGILNVILDPIFMFVILFLLPIVWNSFQKWPDEWWSFYFWFKQIFVVGVIGIVSTVWFTWGGAVDLIRLFKRLDQRGEVDSNDDGMVSAEEKTE